MLLEPLVSTIEMIQDRIDRHGPALRENETRGGEILPRRLEEEEMGLNSGDITTLEE